MHSPTDATRVMAGDLALQRSGPGYDRPAIAQARRARSAGLPPRSAGSRNKFPQVGEPMIPEQKHVLLVLHPLAVARVEDTGQPRAALLFTGLASIAAWRVSSRGMASRSSSLGSNLISPPA